MKTRHLLWIGLLAACSSAVRPAILTQVDAVAAGPSAKESKELAPQAYVRADHLRREAEAAAEAGQTPVAELKAERAIAAYGHAQILARIVKAEQRLVAAKAELKQAQIEAMAVEAKQLTVAAELTSLEKQLQVEREAEVIGDTKAGSPEREAARRTAARTAISQAKLLCIAARQLGGEAQAIDSLLAELTTLDVQAKKAAVAVPLNEALRARSRCQEQLTLARRPARQAAPSSESTDRLFLALSEAGYGPNRDDRGIVVTFDSPDLGGHVDELVGLAKTHDDLPLLVVFRGASANTTAQPSPAEALAKRLRDAGAKSVHAESLGEPTGSPLGLGRQSQRKAQRVELVFVTRL
ncbi:MAG: hypothetical protein QM784_08605 [Polyangiaceae bacterium]